MVADQHRLAHLEVLAHCTGRVGEYDDACAGCARRPHRVHDVQQVMAFVGVDTTGQHQHAVRTDTHRQHLTGVADRSRRGEAGQFGHRQHRGRRAQRGNSRRPPRPQNDRDIVFGDPGALGDELRGPPGERVGVGRTVTHSRAA